MMNRQGAKKMYKVKKQWVAASVAAALIGVGVATANTVQAADTNAPTTTETTEAATGSYTINFVDGDGTTVSTTTITGKIGSSLDDFQDELVQALPAGYKATDESGAYGMLTEANPNQTVTITVEKSADATTTPATTTEAADGSYTVNFVAPDGSIADTFTINAKVGSSLDQFQAELVKAIPAGYKVVQADAYGMLTEDNPNQKVNVYIDKANADSETSANYQVNYVITNDNGQAQRIKSIILNDKPGAAFDEHLQDVADGMPAGYELDTQKAMTYDPSFIAGKTPTANVYLVKMGIPTKYHVDYITPDNVVLGKGLDFSDVGGTSINKYEDAIKDGIPAGYELDTDRGGAVYDPTFVNGKTGHMYVAVKPIANTDPTDNNDNITTDTPTTDETADPEPTGDNGNEVKDTNDDKDSKDAKGDKADAKKLPQTGDSTNTVASSLGVVAVIGTLFGFAGTALKKRS